MPTKSNHRAPTDVPPSTAGKARDLEAALDALVARGALGGGRRPLAPFEPLAATGADAATAIVEDRDDRF